MDVLDQIREILPELTSGERLAAEYILAYPFDTIRFPAASIAENAETSRSNVVRFCQKLGFSGYSEFKYALNRSLREKKHLPQKQEDASGTVLKKYISEFEKLDSLYHSTQLQEIAQMITSARRIATIGRDHSSFSAKQMAFRLSRSEFCAIPIDQETALDSYYTLLDQDDVLMVFSVRASRESYEHVLKRYRESGVKIVLVTMVAKPPVAGLADQVVVLPSAAWDYPCDMLDDAVLFYLFTELLLETIHALPPQGE